MVIRCARTISALKGVRGGAGSSKGERISGRGLFEGEGEIKGERERQARNTCDETAHE